MEKQVRAEPLLLRMTEVADLLGLSRSKVYELASRSEIPTVRLGRSVRVPRAALHAWVERLHADTRAGL